MRTTVVSDPLEVPDRTCPGSSAVVRGDRVVENRGVTGDVAPVAAERGDAGEPAAERHRSGRLRVCPGKGVPPARRRPELATVDQGPQLPLRQPELAAAREAVTSTERREVAHHPSVAVPGAVPDRLWTTGARRPTPDQ
ncbi:hypothetical protein GCM10025875_04570 [Litorihabitans aurantiacus]|uniref:Uncharacterized protein n=1 Tax=Litorihabitans aurantiacus TaxID=1930061 RepID=A0AA37XCY0_9MICO|nr:hypothetical protein GCM10025875_04570 [Litorihabitans aurantiacus]